MSACTQGPVGILQVHPTRLCNLACAHCYSSSGPEERGGLPVPLATQAVRDANAVGFTIVSLSGGEPLLYEGVSDILDAATQVGSIVNLVSNGVLIPSARYERVAGRFGLVALSLDGLPTRHNALRRSPRSFDQVERAARHLHTSGQRFGIIHTLTSQSLEEVEEIAALAVEWGAVLLQLHPFERAGRGANLAEADPLDAHERLVAFVLAAVIQAEYQDRLVIQLDLVHRDTARDFGGVIHAAPLREPMALRQMVLQEDGLLVPLTYGLGPHWAVADLHARRLADAWDPFLETTWPALRRRTRAAALNVARGRYGEVAVWHDVVRRHAGQASMAGAA